jgi:cytochrome c biogenesis protein
MLRVDMPRKHASFFREIWRTLASIKTGVILLILVVILSAAGTLILQRPMTDADEMQRAYSPQVLRVLDAVGLTDVFHSPWFILLLVLVSLSIIAASLDRFPKAWRYFSHPYKSPDDSFRKAVPLHRQFSIPDEETGLVASERALHKMRFRPERVVGTERISLFAERNRMSEMAVYIVHASLLLIFLGGIVDGVFGWRGYVSLVPGQQTNQVSVSGRGSRQLPFSLRCDGAGQENYADGSPKRWWSKLAVLKNGRELQKKEIAVNDPLVFGGVRFYQSSYGATGQLDKLLLTATRRSDGKTADISLSEGQSIELDPETSVRLAQFIPDYVVADGQVYARSQSPENPAVQMFVDSKKTGKSVEVWLPPIEGFAHNQEAPYSFQPRELQLQYYTGLQVSHEPGQWAVWAGCLLMGIGLATAFYLVHMRIWVVPVRDAQGGLSLWLGGMSNKNREAFQDKFARLADLVEEEIKHARSEALAQEHATTLAEV